MKKVWIVLAIVALAVVAGLLIYYFVFADKGANDDSVTGYMMEGTVTEASADSLTIVLPNDSIFTFTITDAIIEAGDEGLQAGDRVAVYYEGEVVEGQQVQTVNVIRVVVLDEPASAGESLVSGVVTDATMNTLSVQVPSGVVYTFSTMDVTVDTAAGDLLVGCTVDVHFTGALDEGQQVQTVEVTSVVVTAPAPVSSASATENSIKGTVTDATMNTVTIEVVGGDTYTFSTEGAAIEADDGGLLLGDVVTIYYQGEIDESQINQTVTVTKVVVTQP